MKIQRSNGFRKAIALFILCKFERNTFRTYERVNFGLDRDFAELDDDLAANCAEDNDLTFISSRKAERCGTFSGCQSE